MVTLGLVFCVVYVLKVSVVIMMALVMKWTVVGF